MSLSKMFVTIFGILLSIGDASAGGAPVFVGLDADMSLGSAQSGEAIRRGMEILFAMVASHAVGGRRVVPMTMRNVSVHSH